MSKNEKKEELLGRVIHFLAPHDVYARKVATGKTCKEIFEAGLKSFERKAKRAACGVILVCKKRRVR